jgi:hypothetical protein
MIEKLLNLHVAFLERELVDFVRVIGDVEILHVSGRCS